MKKLAFAFLVGTYSLAAFAQNPPELKILYIYSGRATAKIASDETIQAFGITNPAVHANFIHGGLKNILANSGLDSSVNSTIAATTVLVPSDGDWKEPIGNDVAEMLTDFNDKAETVDIGGSTLDNFMETVEADITVLVSDTFKLNGAFVTGASVILTNIAGNKANYTIVLDVDQLFGISLSHELGQLGGANHGPDNTPENTNTINGNVSWPYNDTSGEYATIMSGSCFKPQCERLKIFSSPTGGFADDSGTVRTPIGSETQDVTDTLRRLPQIE